MHPTRLKIQKVIGFLIGIILFYGIIRGYGYLFIGTLFSLALLNVFSAYIKITYRGRDY